MARYTEARCRLCRRAQDKLFLKGEKCYTPKCPLERRRVPPGGFPKRGGRKLSDRGIQLREKQKAKQIYGVLEQQFRRFFEMARKMPGNTGENLLILLERRLDNVVYRLGFATSRAQARQIVRHGHIRLNGRRADIPSLLVKPGDVISWAPKSQDSWLYKYFKENPPDAPVPSWLSVDREKMEGRVLAHPRREDIDIKIDEKAIVEYYAR